MRDWSQEQQAIFGWFERGRGNLVVRARAGTGKTTTIIEGVNRATERTILLAAFNKSIATELQNRVDNPRVEAKTLHGLGFKFLRRVWNDVKVDDGGIRAEKLARAAAGALAPDPIVRLIKNLHTKAREIDPFVESPSELVPLAVRFDLCPDDDWGDSDQEADDAGRGPWDTARVCDAAFAALQAAKERTQLIDFADMIFLPLVHKMVKPWFDMVVVDEAQDMTVAQLALATGACKRSGRIAVVGDDRQAIYGFRGADSDSLDRLKAELRAQELSLTTTYRCPKLVVALAKALVPDYTAAPSAPDGEILRVSGDQMLQLASEGDFILSRTNAPLAKICMALLKSGKRARIKGRDIGRGIVALIRRLKARDLGELVVKLGAWKAREVEKALKLGEAGEERAAFVVDQQALIIELTDGLSNIAELEARVGDLFADDAEHRAVMCSTVHRAKGLEAERVFLLEGTFRRGRLEEDNIKYVAITRAKRQLYWVSGYEPQKAN